MATDNEFSAALPKWPAMVVVGDKVSEELAAELIIRCGSPDPFTNDREFESAIKQEFGFNLERFKEDGYWGERYRKERDRICDELVIFSELQYLELERIASSYIGGPHGWCDWSGNIGGQTYNIGAWPGSDEVADEWRLIAKTFPMLRLTCQLFDREYREDGAVPVIQYDVKDGVVVVGEPKAKLEIVGDGGYNIFADGGERGCTIEKLRWAIGLVRDKMKGRKHGDG